jgi:hypothetical protein
MIANTVTLRRSWLLRPGIARAQELLRIPQAPATAKAVALQPQTMESEGFRPRYFRRTLVPFIFCALNVLRKAGVCWLAL